MIQAFGHKKFYNRFDKFYRARFMKYPGGIVYSRKCFDTASEADAYGLQVMEKCGEKPGATGRESAHSCRYR